MEHTIAFLQAEIDSLKDAYKTTVNEEIKTEYSTRILSHKKAIRILNKYIEKQPKNDKSTVIDEFDKQVDIKYLGIPNICFSVTDNNVRVYQSINLCNISAPLPVRTAFLVQIFLYIYNKINIQPLM